METFHGESFTLLQHPMQKEAPGSDAEEQGPTCRESLHLHQHVFELIDAGASGRNSTVEALSRAIVADAHRCVQVSPRGVCDAGEVIRGGALPVLSALFLQADLASAQSALVRLLEHQSPAFHTLDVALLSETAEVGWHTVLPVDAGVIAAAPVVADSGGAAGRPYTIRGDASTSVSLYEARFASFRYDTPRERGFLTQRRRMLAPEWRSDRARHKEQSGENVDLFVEIAGYDGDHVQREVALRHAKFGLLIDANDEGVNAFRRGLRSIPLSEQSGTRTYVVRINMLSAVWEQNSLIQDATGCAAMSTSWGGEWQRVGWGSQRIGVGWERVPFPRTPAL